MKCSSNEAGLNRVALLPATTSMFLSRSGKLDFFVRGSPLIRNLAYAVKKVNGKTEKSHAENKEEVHGEVRRRVDPEILVIIGFMNCCKSRR